MILFKRVKNRSYEIGLYFRDGEFKGLLPAGRSGLGSEYVGSMMRFSRSSDGRASFREKR